MLRIAIAGAAGRMGQMLMQVVQQKADMSLSLATERRESENIGRDAGEIAGVGSIGVLIADSLKSGEFDLLIDFTTPENTLNNLEVCAQAATPAVVGTTGFSDAQLAVIRDYSTKVPLCFAANYSTGVTLSLQLLEQAAKVLGEDSDIEILEAHHRHKVDAPSGTALAMGNVIADVLDRDTEKAFVYSREGLTGAREPGTIGFSTIRAGDIVGDHTVIFASEGERIEITHKASSRMAFAQGAVRAARWMVDQPIGLYDMRDVLGLS